MQTKTATRFRQHCSALIDLFLPKQCPLCRRFCFDHGLCADCWQGLVFITHLFARFLQTPFTALAEPDDLIVPVPIHAKLYLHWRFNQSAELARLLCQQNETGIFAPEALTRPKAGPNTGRVKPKPATAQSGRRVCRATRPTSPHRQSAGAVG